MCQGREDEGSRGTEMLDRVRGRLVTHSSLSFSEESTTASAEPQRSHTDRHTPDPAAAEKKKSILSETYRQQLWKAHAPICTGVACRHLHILRVRHRRFGRINTIHNNKTAAQMESKECKNLQCIMLNM